MYGFPINSRRILHPSRIQREPSGDRNFTLTRSNKKTGVEVTSDRGNSGILTISISTPELASSISNRREYSYPDGSSAYSFKTTTYSGGEKKDKIRVITKDSTGKTIRNISTDTPVFKRKTLPLESGKVKSLAELALNSVRKAMKHDQPLKLPSRTMPENLLNSVMESAVAQDKPEYAVELLRLKNSSQREVRAKQKISEASPEKKQALHEQAVIQLQRLFKRDR